MSDGMHTPGPWELGRVDWYAGPDNGGSATTQGIRSHDEGRPVCIVISTSYSDEEIDANARLIAAAPEMLEALEDVVSRLVEAFPGRKGYPPVLRAFAAISKAKGINPKVEDKPDIG